MQELLVARAPSTTPRGRWRRGQCIYSDPVVCVTHSRGAEGEEPVLANDTRATERGRLAIDPQCLGGGGESRMSTTAATSPHHHITSPVLVTGPDITSSRDGSRVGSGSGSGVSGESETESRWTNTARHHHASQPHRRRSLSRFRDRVRALSFKIGWLGRGQRVLVRSFVRRARSFGGLARSLFRQAVCGGDAGSGRSGGDCACGPHAARLATQSCPRCDSTKYLSRRPDSGPPLVGWLGVFQTGRSASVESCVHM